MNCKYCGEPKGNHVPKSIGKDVTVYSCPSSWGTVVLEAAFQEEQPEKPLIPASKMRFVQGIIMGLRSVAEGIEGLIK